MEQQRTFADNCRSAARLLRAARNLVVAECEPDLTDDEERVRRTAMQLFTRANAVLMPPEE